MVNTFRANRSAGFGSLLGLVVALAIILILASFYLIPFERDEEEKDEPGADMVGGGIPAVRTAHEVQLTAQLISIRDAIRAFEALEGRWPASIDELRNASGFRIADLPEGYSYDYDPQTGKVAIRKGDQIIRE